MLKPRLMYAVSSTAMHKDAGWVPLDEGVAPDKGDDLHRQVYLRENKILGETIVEPNCPVLTRGCSWRR
eukprot:4851322-Amphidinium_carterae.2